MSTFEVAEQLTCRTRSAHDGAMYCSAVAGFSGFTGKIKRSAQRPGEYFARPLSADCDVTVSTLTVRVALPVVNECVHELRFDMRAPAKERLEARER